MKAAKKKVLPLLDEPVIQTPEEREAQMNARRVRVCELMEQLQKIYDELEELRGEACLSILGGYGDPNFSRVCKDASALDNAEDDLRKAIGYLRKHFQEGNDWL